MFAQEPLLNTQMYVKVNTFECLGVLLEENEKQEEHIFFNLHRKKYRVSIYGPNNFVFKIRFTKTM